MPDTAPQAEPLGFELPLAPGKIAHPSKSDLWLAFVALLASCAFSVLAEFRAPLFTFVAVAIVSALVGLVLLARGISERRK